MFIFQQCFGSALVSQRIRIQLLYLNADPGPGSQTNADACGLLIRIQVRLCRHKKLVFDMKNIPYIGGTKAILKGLKSGYVFVKFGQFIWSWIRIRIPNTDPDLVEQNQCGSEPETLYFRYGICLYSTWVFQVEEGLLGEMRDSPAPGVEEGEGRGKGARSQLQLTRPLPRPPSLLHYKLHPCVYVTKKSSPDAWTGSPPAQDFLLDNVTKCGLK